MAKIVVFPPILLLLHYVQVCLSLPRPVLKKKKNNTKVYPIAQAKNLSHPCFST